MSALRQQTQRGFTLVEAVIAALVVSVAMLGVAKLQGVTLFNSGDTRMKTHALNLAQEKIEQLRTFANEDTYTGMGGSTDSQNGENGTFTRTWTISPCPNSVGCKQANVTVNWTDPRGAVQNVALTSFIAGADPVKSGLAVLAKAVPTSSPTPTTTTPTTPSNPPSTPTPTSTTSTSTPPTSTPPTPPKTPTPSSFDMVAPQHCGQNLAQPCVFDRGSEGGVTIQISILGASGNSITPKSVSASIPTIIIPNGELQPSIIGGISINSGLVNFMLRGPGCYQINNNACQPSKNGGASWVGLSATPFTVIVTVDGIPFTVYMKTDG